MSYQIQFLWKGFIPYRESLKWQEQLKLKAQKNKKAFFLGFHCPACITLGLRGKKSQDLNIDSKECKKKGLEVLSIKRGGQATLHSKGQLVIYPILDLLKWKLRPRDFLSLLENISQDTLKDLGIQVEKRDPSAGLFTDKGKIIFFGIHISQGVTQHGLAINLQNDLSLFKLIKSCGKLDRPHDSFQQRGINKPLTEVFKLWCKKASQVFYDKVS